MVSFLLREQNARGLKLVSLVPCKIYMISSHRLSGLADLKRRYRRQQKGPATFASGARVFARRFRPAGGQITAPFQRNDLTPTVAPRAAPTVTVTAPAVAPTPRAITVAPTPRPITVAPTPRTITVAP